MTLPRVRPATRGGAPAPSTLVAEWVHVGPFTVRMPLAGLAAGGGAPAPAASTVVAEWVDVGPFSLIRIATQSMIPGRAPAPAQAAACSAAAPSAAAAPAASQAPTQQYGMDPGTRELSSGWRIEYVLQVMAFLPKGGLSALHVVYCASRANKEMYQLLHERLVYADLD